MRLKFRPSDGSPNDPVIDLRAHEVASMLQREERASLITVTEDWSLDGCPSLTLGGVADPTGTRARIAEFLKGKGVIILDK